MVNHKAVQNSLQKADKVLVVIPSSPSDDVLASSLALYLALSNKGKTVNIVSPSIPSGRNHLNGIENISTEPMRKDLLLSFDYDKEQIESIGHHIDSDEGKAYITIASNRGQEPLDPESIEYSQVGIDADVMVFFEVDELEELQELYSKNETAYSEIEMLSFHTQEVEYASKHVDVSEYSSYAEVVSSFFDTLNIFDKDSATNLYFGLVEATKNFTTPSVTAQTFETAALLVKSGAERE